MRPTRSTYSDGSLMAIDVGEFGNVIDHEAVQLRITGRYPSSGPPKGGVPFAVDVEVETFRNWWWIAFTGLIGGGLKCPDAIVIARRALDLSIVGSVKVVTSALDNCHGESRLVFSPTYRPLATDQIIFEVYPADAKITRKNRVARSDVINLELGTATGTEQGIYTNPTPAWYTATGEVFSAGFNEVDSLFNEVDSLLKKVIIIGAAGAGAYFLLPFLPAIRTGFSSVANKTKTLISGKKQP